MINTDAPKIIKGLLEKLQDNSLDFPYSIKKFSALTTHVFKDGLISEKHKHSLALAIAMALKSEECVAFHLRALILIGFNKLELMEIIEVVTYMSGGLGLAAGLSAIQYFDNLNENDAHT